MNLTYMKKTETRPRAKSDTPKEFPDAATITFKNMCAVFSLFVVFLCLMQEGKDDNAYIDASPVYVPIKHKEKLTISIKQKRVRHYKASDLSLIHI